MYFFLLHKNSKNGYSMYPATTWFLKTRISFSTRMFVVWVSGILQGGAVPFFHMNFI